MKKKFIIAAAFISIVGIGFQKSIVNTYAAAPVSYDLHVYYGYNPSAGYYSIWANTTSGGGVTTEVLFTDQGDRYSSSISNFFFSQEFTIDLRIYQNASNNAMFTNIGAGKYRYNSPGHLGIYHYSHAAGLKLYTQVNDPTYSLAYSPDVSNTSSSWWWYSYVGNLSIDSVYTTAAQTNYKYLTTYSLPSRIETYQFGEHLNGFYFKLINTGDTSDNYTDIWNQGYDYGYYEAQDYWYNLGLTEGVSQGSGYAPFFDSVNSMIISLSDWFNIELFPSITLGALIFTPVVFGMIFVLIKKLGG